jgi:hypothetical protein
MPDQSPTTTRRSPRITTVPGKVVYVVVWWASGFALSWILRFSGVPETAISEFAFAWDLAFLIVGAQTFRVRGEAITSVRPWWQATGRAPASRGLGGLTALGAAVALANVVRWAIVGAEFEVVWAAVCATLTYVVAAAFYLNSAARLKASGGGVPEPVKISRAGRV